MTALKKIELHLHIEGAAPPALIRSLAAEKKQDLNGIFDANGAYSYQSFHDFLRVYEAATSVLTSPRDYARLLTKVLGECAEHGAIYAELFVSPEFCGGGDLVAWRDYLAAMEEAAQADRELVMSRGHIVMEGTPEQVFSQTERLHSYHLDVPQAAELRDELVKLGIPMPENVITPEACAEELFKLLK